ncbi:endonuclease/exonuclease/phosphatase family protein [Paenibacillus cellulositrophicus]|uniref:endonuclease/exonuclease/phosphatase family protein n=1 Tax=Paenibacillus cellulositrophicus TaxID=562959 RepID=UPI00203DDD79|nr:endonuclease/exonuclease/phosphatase family protein [Paenibacillus cellulositrophicus]MCM2997777.1 endonuclease/exonuclease/phosphatase family protein [Paenibacillus cellulositrophicus]
MKKHFITSIVSLLIVSLFSTSAMAAGHGNGKEIRTTVMSYNIHHGVGLDEQLSLKRIADVIRDSGAEIVGLQEVDRFFGERSDFQDQAKELADLLGYHYAYGANLDWEPAEGQTNNRQYGTAILSKYPILRSDNVLLSSFGDEQRGVLHAVVNLRGVHVDVYNTHLGLDAASRKAQVQEIVNLASAVKGPKLLTGDFNAEPDSPEFQALLASKLFVNSFQGVENAYTFPADQPSETIDYIVTSPEVQHSNPRVIATEASDHRPIAVDVVFKR